jgi:hypothetical protein
MGQKSDFLGETSPALRDKIAKLVESSEMSVHRNTLKGWTPEQLASPNFLEELVAFSHMRQFRRTTQMRGILKIQMGSIMTDLST